MICPMDSKYQCDRDYPVAARLLMSSPTHGGRKNGAHINALIQAIAFRELWQE
jgi:hypothetical protein